MTIIESRLKTFWMLAFASVFFVGQIAVAGEWDSIPEKKVSALKLYMHPKEAYEIMSGEDAKKTLFVDIRTSQEAMFVGMSTLVDASVPYMVMADIPEYDASRKGYKMVPNSGFLSTMDELLKGKGLAKTDRVILICRSGDRSATAATLMSKAGYTNVYSVLEGFEGDMSKDGRRSVNGWKNDGLPWSYELPAAKLTNLR